MAIRPGDYMRYGRAVLLLLALLSVAVCIQSPGDDVDGAYTEDGFEIIVSDGYGYVKGYYGPVADTVVIPETVTVDGNEVTIVGIESLGCMQGVREVVIPSTVDNISVSTEYSGSDTLESIVVSDDNQNYISVDGIVYTKDMGTLVMVPSGISGEVNVLDGTEYINSRSFYKCDKVTGVVLPESISTIYEYAFDGCSSLEYLDASCAEDLRHYAFQGSSITDLVLDGDIALRSYSLLNLAEGCTVRFTGDDPSYYMQDGFVISKERGQVYAYTGSMDHVCVPEGVTYFSLRFVSGCHVGLLELPSSLTLLLYTAQYILDIDEVVSHNEIYAIDDRGYLMDYRDIWQYHAVVWVPKIEGTMEISAEDHISNIFMLPEGVDMFHIEEGGLYVGGTTPMIVIDNMVFYVAPVYEGVLDIGSYSYSARMPASGVTGFIVSEDSRYHSVDERGILYDASGETIEAVPAGYKGDLLLEDVTVYYGALTGCNGIDVLTIGDGVIMMDSPDITVKELRFQADFDLSSWENVAADRIVIDGGTMVGGSGNLVFRDVNGDPVTIGTTGHHVYEIGDDGCYREVVDRDMFGLYVALIAVFAGLVAVSFAFLRYEE